MNRKLQNFLYSVHVVIVWAGSLIQIHKTFTTHSSGDIAWLWVAAIFVSEVLALPLACGSKYFVWKLCHIVGAILVAILLGGVIYYQRGN